MMKKPHIFVFGSNEAGVHGAGAAKHAHEKHNAEWGVGEGWTGTAYAIPTKSYGIKTLSLVDIAGYVDRFIQFAKDNPKFIFEVTRIGCGLAGYRDEQIAPMFKGAPKNCRLP